jgi:16S rRNA (guanine966-N2)-methyltransferase
MRVIAGEFRRRVLKTPPGLATRPTPDRLREALFSIVAREIEGVRFVDLYAGSGSVGIEALSRGAANCVFVERDRVAAAVLRANLAALKAESRAEVFVGKAREVIRIRTGDIVFLDPPYEAAVEYRDLLDWLGEHPPALVLAQHSSREPLAAAYGRLRRVRELRQGGNTIAFYRAEAGVDAGVPGGE